MMEQQAQKTKMLDTLNIKSKFYQLCFKVKNSGAFIDNKPVHMISTDKLFWEVIEENIPME